MKKLFLLCAFTGIVGAASATTIATFTKTSTVNVGGDDKKGDDKKKKDEKACCKKDANGKTSCCHAKTEAKADTKATSTTTATTTTTKAK